MSDLNNYAISVIRTVVPITVGNAITSFEVFLGVDLDNAALQVAAVSAVTGAYYLAVRFAEAKYPNIGLLLGWKAKPIYDEAPPAG